MMEEKQMSFKNKLIIHGLMKLNGKYLLIKRSEIKRGKPNDYASYWDIPGGSLEDYETPREGVIRETKEEVGLSITVGEIIHEDSNFDKEKNAIYTRLVYECTVNEDEVEINLDPEEHVDYILISKFDDIKNEKVVPYLVDILTKKEMAEESYVLVND